jgi:hypothetical protein
MKFKFTRKTWYFMLLAAASLGMADGIGMLAGADLSFFETVSFGLCGLSALFLAAEKAPAVPGEAHRAANPHSGLYFACFLAALVSYLAFGGAHAMQLTVFWPLLVFIEQKRGFELRQQWRLLLFSEIIHALAFCAVSFGKQENFATLAVVLWILTSAARGWAALALYRRRDPDAGVPQ